MPNSRHFYKIEGTINKFFHIIGINNKALKLME